MLCSDGRWYHPVVAEKANEAWSQKVKFLENSSAFSCRQSERARKRWQNRKDAAGHATGDAMADAGRITTAVAGRNAIEIEKEKEKEKDKESSNELSSSANAPDVPVSGSPAAQPPEPSEGYTAEFEAFWAIYPRHEGKGAAFRAFKQAKKRATVERMIDGAKNYRRRVLGADPRFTKQAAMWLNGDCWNDEAPPSNAPPTKTLAQRYPQAANGG